MSLRVEKKHPENSHLSHRSEIQAKTISQIWSKYKVVIMTCCAMVALCALGITLCLTIDILKNQIHGSFLAPWHIIASSIAMIAIGTIFFSYRYTTKQQAQSQGESNLQPSQETRLSIQSKEVIEEIRNSTPQPSQETRLSTQPKDVTQKTRSNIPQSSQQTKLSTQSQDMIQEIRNIAQSQGFVAFYDDKSFKNAFIFGNFYPCRNPITYKGCTSHITENLFQAAKFDDLQKRRECAGQPNGDQALKFARRNTQQTRKTWHKKAFPQIPGIDPTCEKHLVMFDILKAKAETNLEYREALLATGNAYLVEHTAQNSEWGDGGDGTGFNWLGILHMSVRELWGGRGIVPRPEKYEQFLRKLRPPSNTDRPFMPHARPFFLPPNHPDAVVI